MKSISLEISFMVDWISRRKRPAAYILDGPIVYNLRSLILVKFMSMFVSNTTGVKVNTFCCHLPLSPTTHPGIPKPKNFFKCTFLVVQKFLLCPKKLVWLPKKCLGRRGEVPFGKEEDFHLALYCLISTWISYCLTYLRSLEPTLIIVSRANVQTKLPLSRCLPTNNIYYKVSNVFTGLKVT